MFELYISETCPYCRKVMDFLDEENIEYDIKDVSITQNREKLLKLGGMLQVPFLHDDNTNLYESDDIIEYVKSRV